jgi:hypothetical protein
MTPDKLKLAALSMDLKRVALGYHGQSIPTAERFVAESLKKSKALNQKELPSYVVKIIHRMEEILSDPDKQKVAEDALMYSTILQNAAVANI